MALMTVDSLTTDDVLNIFANEQARAVKRLHEPKGRDVFIFDTDGGKNG
jgi:hypothetical protein